MEGQEKLRVGIVGCGAVARRIHAPGLRLCANVEIAAACDSDPQAAAALGATRAFSDHREMLAQARPDAVIVAVPNHLHRRVALDEFACGASGTLEISRICPGRGDDLTETMTVEIYGTRGGAVMSMDDPLGLRVALGEDGRDPAGLLKRVKVAKGFYKLVGSPRDLSADDPRWGYRYDQAWRFVESVRAGATASPSFEDGLRCQKVIEAVLRSGKRREWVEIEAASTA